MSFKKYLLKKVLPIYFMIVTFLNVGMLIVGQIFFEESRFGYEIFFSPLLFGLLGCIPTLLEFLFKGKTVNKSTIILQNIVQLVILEICILGAAKLGGVIDSVLTAIIIACMIFIIFVIVSVLQYLQDKSLCTEMNMALSQYKKAHPYR